MIVVAIFWISVAVIVYTLVVFPLLVALRALLLPRRVQVDEIEPAISVVIAAYNEEHTIAKRIENLLSCDYPLDKLEIVIASDGSSDATHEIVRSYADRNVKLVELPRRGKGQAINGGVAAAMGEVLVFTDANTHFAEDALRRLIAPFADPTVGGVAGNQVYLRDDKASLTADGERAYWSLDSKLKQLQSRGGSATSATGAIYAVRRSLCQTIPEDAMDDFIISTGVVARGYRLVFAPDALAFEAVAVKGRVEFSRKLRVIMQGLRSVMHQRRLLNPFRHGFYAVQLFSHKVLRRMLWLPLLIILIILPCLWHEGLVFRLALIGATGFLALSVLGWMLQGRRIGRAKLLTVPFFICMVNVAAAVSVLGTLFGRRVHRWEPERHAQSDSARASELSEGVSS